MSIVVPAFNEVDSLSSLFELVGKFSLSCTDSIELVVVENGSTDFTRSMLREMNAESYPFYLKLLELDSNIGYGGAIKAGILASNCEVVMILPADGKYHLDAVEDCYLAYKNLASAPTMVKGLRTLRNDPFSVQVLSFLYTLLTNILFRVFLRDTNGLPKIFNKNLIQSQLNELPNNACFDAGLIAVWRRNQGNFCEVAVRFEQPSLRTASWSGKRLQVSLLMFLEIVKFFRNLERRVKFESE